MEEAMKEAATKKSRHKYDEAFKENALKMVENGQSVRSVAQGLGVAENLVHSRRRQKMRNLSRTSVDAEVAELRARLRQVEAERDVLKKALSIFSRQS
jgi:transposase